MNKDLDKTLVQLFPSLYRDYGGDMRKTCMAWGFSCGDGWYPILLALSIELTGIEKEYNIQVVADQVKEKFGGLRFYYHTEGSFKWYQRRWQWLCTFMCSHGFAKLYWKFIAFRKKLWRNPGEKVSDAVESAEAESYKTCEVCSNPGKPTRDGWITTLCERCKKESDDRRNN